MSDPACYAVGCRTTFWVEAYLHVARTQNLLPSHALLNRETRLNGKKRKLADVTKLEDQVSDFRRCVPYLLYYGDVSEEAFGLLVEQMRHFGVRVVAYPRRDDLKHLEARGVIGFFMGPGDGPSMDRVYVKSTTKSTVRQYRHLVTPRVCLEEYAMKLDCSELHTASDMSDEQILADEQELPDFERGLFEVDARDPDEVLPYTDEPFMDRVRTIAARSRSSLRGVVSTGFSTTLAALLGLVKGAVAARRRKRDGHDTVRAVPADPTRRTVGKRGVNVQWQAGEHLTISRHNQPRIALHTVEHPREHRPEDAIKSPPYGPTLLFARDATRSTPEVAAGVVAETCERMLSLWEPDLGPTWDMDVEHPPAPDAHVGIE